MSHCRVHGLEYEHRNGCWRCREELEAAANDRTLAADELARQSEILADIRRAGEALENRGDHECPLCLNRGLRRSALRCVICHGDSGTRAYWASVAASEETVRWWEQKKADEWERAAPTRAAEAKLQAERQAAADAPARAEAQRAAERERQSARRVKVLLASWLWFGPILGVFTWILLIAAQLPDLFRKASIGEFLCLLVVSCVPVLNWLMLVVASIDSEKGVSTQARSGLGVALLFGVVASLSALRGRASASR